MIKNQVYIFSILFATLLFAGCNDESNDSNPTDTNNDGLSSFNITVSDGPAQGQYTGGAAINTTSLVMSATYAEVQGESGISITLTDNNVNFKVSGIINLVNNNTAHDLGDGKESWDIGDDTSVLIIQVNNSTSYISLSGTVEIEDLQYNDFTGDGQGPASVKVTFNGTFDIGETPDTDESINVSGEMVFNSNINFQ